MLTYVVGADLVVSNFYFFYVFTCSIPHSFEFETMRILFSANFDNETRTGNRYQARSEAISSSFSSSRSNRDVTSFPRNFIVGPTNGRTNGRTDGPMDQHSLVQRRYFSPKKGIQNFMELATSW
jgi:hypothetical protein